MNAYPDDSELIRKLVAFANATPAGVAKKAGVAVSTVNRPFNGSATNRLGRSVLEKLQQAFPDFPGWGETSVSDRQLPFLHASEEPAPDFVEIAEVDIRYGLGGTYLDAPVSTETRLFSRAWLRHFTRARPQDLFWTVGDGDSMKPTINSGDVILVDRSQQSPVMGDGIWALAYGEVGMIKRLRPLPDGTIEVHSDNDRVRPFIAADGELHVIGRVVARIERL